MILFGFEARTEIGMAWTETSRKHYERQTERYSSDTTDEEWAVISPLLPGPNRLARPRKVDLRDVWDAIGYVAAPEVCVLTCGERFSACFHGAVLFLSLAQ